MSTTTLIDSVRNHLLRTATWSKPATWWVALFTTLPDINGAGGVEVSTVSTGYARVQLGPSDANWGTDGRNLVTIQYGLPTADWGAIAGVGLMTASTAGTLWVRGNIVSAGVGKPALPLIISVGSPAPRFLPGALQVVVN